MVTPNCKVYTEFPFDDLTQSPKDITCTASITVDNASINDTGFKMTHSHYILFNPTPIFVILAFSSQGSTFVAAGWVLQMTTTRKSPYNNSAISQLNSESDKYVLL